MIQAHHVSANFTYRESKIYCVCGFITRSISFEMKMPTRDVFETRIRTVCNALGAVVPVSEDYGKLSCDLRVRMGRILWICCMKRMG